MKKKGNAAFASEQRGRKPSSTSAGYNALSAQKKVVILEKRVLERDEEIDFLKKYMPSLQNCKIKIKHWYKAIYMACIDGNYVPYRLCKSAGIEPSGYYHYVKRLTKHTIKKCNNDKILADINFLQTKHKQSLGYRQITMQLNRFYKKVGITKVNSKRVLRLMKENNLLA